MPAKIHSDRKVTLTLSQDEIRAILAALRLQRNSNLLSREEILRGQISDEFETIDLLICQKCDESAR